MHLRRLRPALVLSVWTLLVWTTRIRNIWTDDSLTTTGQVGRTVLAGVFTVFAAVTIALWVGVRRHPGPITPNTIRWVRAFAAWTVVVWIVRTIQIALADHGIAFTMVHTALAIASIGLAQWADRRVRDVSEAAPTATGSRPTPA